MYVLASIDTHRRLDSVQIGYVVDIIRLSLEGPYLEGMRRLTLNHPIEEAPSIGCSLEEAFNWAQEGNHVIEIADRHDETTRARVLAHDSSTVRIAVYTKAGVYEGDEILPLKGILRLELNSLDCRSIETLLATEA